MKLSRVRRRRRLIALVPILVGLAVLLSAVAQPLKARVGQSLLASTLESRLAANSDDRVDPDNWRAWPWADVAPIAELHFPRLDESRIVLDSASGEALAWGVGHMAESAQLGSPGLSVVAGHRDGAFALLGDLIEGDAVELTTVTGQSVRYRVSAREVVDSGRVQLPIVHTGRDELVLTTCWPIDALVSGPERLVLRASPVG